MKRWTLRVCLFLLLGAIVNIAVAWGCSIKVKQNRPRVLQYLDAPPRQLEKFIPPEWISKSQDVIDRSLHYSEYDAVGVSSVQFMVSRSTRKRQWDCLLRIYRAGLPCRSLGCEKLGEFSTTVPHPQHLRWGIYAPRFAHAETESLLMVGLSQPRPVPLRPIWPGFAINTLFYAGILWLLVAVTFAWRRWRRIKRGLCPACAYPVGTSDLCTECGKPVQAKA